MNNQKTSIQLTLKQTKCWDAFWNPGITSILFGGAMGGGKTYIGCLLLYRYAKWVIKNFKLSATKYRPAN